MAELSFTTEELGQFSTIYQFIGTDPSCQVTSFHILRVPVNASKENPVEAISPDQFNDQLLKLLKNVRTGDVVYIEKINSVADCLQYQGRGANAFKIIVL